MAGSFLESAVPDITESIPTHISARVGAPIYVAKGIKADVAIAELAFRYAISDSLPYVRQTADFRRTQIDTSTEPGEQTLAQWWVRDQDSWHKGAGINYYEPGSDSGITRYRYASSYGVDVWTQGEAKLLHRMMQVETNTAPQYATSAIIGGVNNVIGNEGGQVFRTDGDNRTNFTGAAGVGEPVMAGSRILVGTSTGIASGVASGTTLAALWTGAAGVVRPWWVKSRIIAAVGPSLYELSMVGGTWPTTPLYTHPDPLWTWSGVAEAPEAIIASGYSSGYGYIYRFTLDSSGTGTPTLGAASQVADFPPGEEVRSIKGYLSAYLAIGTTRGLRIGILDTDGSFRYGPLLFETTHPVAALGARDSFIYAGVQGDINGRSGCARVDLSTTTDDTGLRFAWAYDVAVPDAPLINSVTFLGTTEGVVLATANAGVWAQDPDQYEPDGVLLSGRIRYGTLEDKAFNRLKVRADITGTSSIDLVTVNSSENEEFIIGLGGSWDDSQDITLKSIADVGSSHASIKLVLHSSTDGTATPVLQGFQLKATPLPRIQRTITLPLILNDIEEDGNGNKSGRYGMAYERLAALEDLEQSKSVVLVQDFTSGEAFAAQVRTIQFQRNTPVSRNRKNWGGVVQVEVLKL
jgi:hypothetical protein